MGQDLPHGNYAALRRAGSLAPSNTGREYLVAVRNYRTWVLTALYAFNFGVELTMNNGEKRVMACAAAANLKASVAPPGTGGQGHAMCSASANCTVGAWFWWPGLTCCPALASNGSASR